MMGCSETAGCVDDSLRIVERFLIARLWVARARGGRTTAISDETAWNQMAESVGKFGSELD